MCAGPSSKELTSLGGDAKVLEFLYDLFLKVGQSGG
jgi:hypothetical protein